MNIPYGKQNITEEDIQAVVNALRSDFLTQGPKIKEFEEAFAKYIGCEYAIAVSNGTAALHLSALALNVKSGDKVITTPITFSATSNCIRYCGGNVVFADINSTTYLLDIEKVKQLLVSAPKGTYKGIIPVDLGGLPVNMEEFRNLADEFGLWIIEDACHAPGGYFRDKVGKKHFCGDGAFADLSIFSFHPVKHIATGEGGMITTNNRSLYEKLLTLRTHGIIRDKERFENPVSLALNVSSDENSYPGWYMEMQELGYNYRITDFQAALGLSQLKRADDGVKRRRAIAKRYDDAFAGLIAIQKQSYQPSSDLGHAFHLYIIEVDDRLGLYNYLKSNNIFTQVHYIPVHLMPYYRKQGWMLGDMPIAEKYYSRCLSLPLFPSLTEEEQSFVITKILDFFSK